jgi:O-antigen chain-terminating methyltransferase
MLRLYSDTHDVAALHQALHYTLGQTPATPAPRPVITPIPERLWWWRLRQRLRKLPGLRRAYRLLRAPWLLRQRLHHLQLQTDAAQRRMDHLETELQALQRQQRTDHQYGVARQHHQQLHIERLALEQRFMANTLNRLPSSHTPHNPPQAMREHPAQAEWYLAFEAGYRGTPDDIKQRQRAYLPFVQAAIPDPNSGLVVDLGCGRGEWLSLLREEGYQTLGVDSNPAMLQAARDQGLNVQQGDLLEALRLCEPGRIAVLSAFQVVEHLPLAVVLEVLSEARRVMRPGGVLLLETPNPENLQVSSYSFWLDPTHQHPLPPPLLANLAQYFGFIDIHIERVSPWPQPPPAPAAEAPPQAQRLHQLLYCEQDYALIVRQPLEDHA